MGRYQALWHLIGANILLPLANFCVAEQEKRGQSLSNYSSTIIRKTTEQIWGEIKCYSLSEHFSQDTHSIILLLENKLPQR